MNIPFSPPYIDKDIENEVLDSLRSGWITSGPKVKALEEEVQRQQDVKAAIAVNSWTSGAILMLRWFAVGQGDEVIVPAYTYAATALAVMHCGATPVIVDVKDDFNIDPEAVKAAITEKTKAVIPVDIGGYPADYDEIYNVLEEKKDLFNACCDQQLKFNRPIIISDCAHSFGAVYKKRKAGNFGDVDIFSFHAVKNITTAEGGMICLNLPDTFNLEEERKYIKLMTLNGQTKDAYTKSQAGGWQYDIIDLGMKINMPDICAAIGLVQLKKYENQLLPERKRVVDHYRKFFSNFDWAILPPYDNEEKNSSHHLFQLRIKDCDELQRNEIIAYAAKKEVSTNVHFIPLPMLTLFKKINTIDNYSGAYNCYKNEISLPVYPQLTEEQLETVCSTVKEAYHSVFRVTA
jgi:dTDP-4-amino-4,6-dideoxygalactose transaminase